MNHYHIVLFGKSCLKGFALLVLPLILCVSVVADTMTFELSQVARVEAGYQTGENGNNYGSNPNVRGNSPNNLLKGYIRVDLTGLPANAIVTEATFSIWSNSSSAQDVNLYAIEDGAANEAFQSGTITWDNAPGNSTYTEAGGSGSFVANNVGMDSADATSLGNLGASTPSALQGNRDVYAVTFSGSDLDFINDDSNGVVTFALTPDVSLPHKGFFGNNNAETGLTLTYTVDNGGLPAFLSGVISEGIGVNTGTTTNALNNTDLANMQAAGVKYVRIRAAWPDVEKTQGTYTWTNLDNTMAKLDQYGLQPIFLLAYTAPGYNTDGIIMNETAERQGFANYAAAAVTRYNAPGVVWEIWNEPNTDNFWPGYSADNYMGLIDAAVPAMKAADPSCFVVGGSVLDMVWAQTDAWLERCFELGFANQCDGLSVHPYSGPGKSAKPERVADEIIELRNRMADWNIPADYPILNTEYGATYTSFSGTTTQRQEEQGAVCVRMALLNSYTGIYQSVWYEWQPSGGNQLYALTNSNDTLRPGYNALDVLTDQFDGYFVEGRVPGYRAEDFVLVLSNGTNRKLAVWTGGASVNLEIPLSVSSGSFSTVTTYGTTGSASASGGELTIGASAFPVYVDLGSVNVAPTSTLLSLDVPSLTLDGSVSESGGTYTLEGSGTGIRFAVDRFHYGYETLEGDGEVLARVDSLTAGGAGVMMRSDLGSGSKNVTTLVRTSGNAEFIHRAASSAQATVVVDSSQNFEWVSVNRSGDTFTSRASVDGVTWVELGSATIDMGDILYVGLVATSYNNSVLATAVFDNYEIMTGAAAPETLFSADIGNAVLAGSVTEDNGLYTIEASGNDIWGFQDGFHFVYREMTGDGELIAEVQSLVNSHSAAKAGVMIRETLDANSKHASSFVTPASGGRFSRRTATGGSTASTTGGGSPPYWVRMVRSGNTFTGYHSSDGVTWTQTGSETITMGSTVYVGMAVTSHTNLALTEAEFDSFQIND
ncbi:MAG: DNRLRE domain-containing protein [Verrucomicrobiota bacterium]